jgi:hypothetical protein
MATLTGMLTGQGSGSVSVPAARRPRRAPMTAQLRNAYGKLPQWVDGSRTPPKLSAADRNVIAQVYARFGDPSHAFAAYRRRGYRQHALHIADIGNASAGEIARARAHHALGYTPVAPGPPPHVQTVTGVGAGQGTGSASLSAAMSGSPTGGKPVLPAGVSAAELGALSKALTPGQRRRVGLL